MLVHRFKHNRQSGFSLIELMIAAAIGLLLLSSVMSIFISSMKHTSDSSRFIRLNQELDAVIDLMAGEIRRASFNSTSRGTTATPTSYKTYLATSNTNFGLTVLTTSCIVYSYDRDGDGIKDSNESFGFRLQGNEVQYRSDGVNDCTVTGWQAITDPSAIVVTGLTITLVERCVNTTAVPSTESTTGCPTSTAGDILFKTKKIDIELKGKSTNNASTEKTLKASVRLRNDQWLQV